MEAVAAIATVAQAMVAVAMMPWFKRMCMKLKQRVRGEQNSVVPYSPSSSERQSSSWYKKMFSRKKVKARNENEQSTVVPGRSSQIDRPPTNTTAVIEAPQQILGLTREVQLAYIDYSYRNAVHSRECTARDIRHLRVCHAVFVISIYIGLTYMLSRPYFGLPSRLLVSTLASYFLYKLAPQ